MPPDAARQRCADHCRSSLGSQLQQPQTHDIGLVGDMIDQTFGHEMGELAVHRAARLAASLDNVGEAHRFFGKGDKLQKRDGLTKRAGYAFLFRSKAGTTSCSLSFGFCDRAWQHPPSSVLT